MDKFKISNFLEGFDKISRRGKCKACQKTVNWARIAVAAHKRMSCENASAEEKRSFSKRNLDDSSNNSGSDISIDGSQNEHAAHRHDKLTEEQTKDIDSKMGNFFFRTGISLRLVDSEALKDLVTALNPSYAATMPSSKTLSGKLLDQQYDKCSQLMEEVLEASENLTLESDGWTNIRGDHIVNFCVKAPNHKPFFYTSIDTSGITQNAQAVADEIIKVFEKLGPAKFSCLITDNACHESSLENH